MAGHSEQAPQRVLIASANPLFGKGLEKLLQQRWKIAPEQVRLAGEMSAALEALDQWQPDLVLVDYDDETIERARFLDHLIQGGGRALQVVMVSLRDSGEVVVYDRQTFRGEQAGDWLEQPWPTPAPSPEQPRRQDGMKHFVIVGVLVVIFTVLTNFGLQSAGLLPVQASAQASIIDQLFNAHYWVISFLFSLIGVFMVYSIVVFRRRGENDTQQGKFFKGSTKLEIFWTIIPLGTVLYFSYLGSLSLADIRRVEPQALVVNVTAGQWYWRFEYPETGITSGSLVLPVGEQVLLKMTSADVIHSFWVPEFRVKQDILPGNNLVKELRFTPTLTGEYKVLCAELCGGAHANMNAPVIVMDKADFAAWEAGEMAAVSSDPVARGERLAKNNGCLGCHSLDGSPLVGPTWKGMAGSTHELVDGSSVTVDEAYLIQAILEPNAAVVKGFPPGVMPATYADQFSEQQIADLVAYMQSLK